MPAILPFRACRALPQFVEQFSISAYNNPAQSGDSSGVETNPISYLRIENPSAIGGHVLETRETYELSRAILKEIVKQGVLVWDEKESLYVYRQVKGNHVYTGIIGLVPLDDYRNGHVKKHEKTREDREQEIANYSNQVRVSGSPVLLTYEEVPELELIIQQIVDPAPLYHFITSSNTEHFLWQVDDVAMVNRINSLLKKVKDFYIADGHHRCEGYLAIKDNPPPGLMACLIPSNQLFIQSFYRMVTDIGDMRRSELVDALSQIFEVERLNEYCLPDAPGIIHLLMKNKYYKLKIPAKYKETGNAKACLDVSILENLVFKNILKIEDTRSSERIYFLNGAESPEKIKYLLDEKKVRAVFALYPLDIKDVIEISDAGETMPPKSTWIEPKLRSGLVIHSF